DHGKTSLVDGMLKQSGIFHARQQVADRVMDSNELERERGITILSKNTSITYGDVRINIVDTPGHVDFSGEVERILGMVDGCLLVVDAFEGPMAQTRFVLRKSLEAGLQPLVVINKIDRADARPQQVIDEVFELFYELGADDAQLDFPVVFASARQQIATRDLKVPATDMRPLFDAIVEYIPGAHYEDGPLQILVNSVDYDEYIGRVAIGRVHRGKAAVGMQVMVTGEDEPARRGKIVKLYNFEGLQRKEVTEAGAGDIVALAGIEGVMIGETITDPEVIEALPAVQVDEPALAMVFQVNDSPLAGRDGKWVTSRHLRERLFREVERNIALRVDEVPESESAVGAFNVCGRGELHLSILIETMRREGYELAVSRPRVITKEIDGALHEPVEMLYVDTPEEYFGAVMEALGPRYAQMQKMSHPAPGAVRLEFLVPARGLIGFRSQLLTVTRGYATMNHLSAGHAPWAGEIADRTRGALIASEDGLATTYAMFHLQDRGRFFIEPTTQVYKGMIVGEHARDNDLEVNIAKKKHVTNMRSSGAEDTMRLDTPQIHSLEEAIEWIGDDELVEVTPKNIRMRKALLDPAARNRAQKAREAREKANA
ncbi:MAG: translational GTPase TypA, partial [Proteobacteria bacterium]|nr:translational GTPase TypA [Pseudomonadota bacterium]